MPKNVSQLEQILDECIDRVIGGESMAQVLVDYSELVSEIEPLLKAALVAKSAAASIAPRLEFRFQAKQQFLAQVRDSRQEESQKTWRFPDLFRWTRQWAVAVAAVLVVMILGGGGTVMASADSMPDDFFYPVKTFVEDVRISLAGSDMAKAELAAEFADRRIDEIAQMAEEGKTSQVEKASRRLSAQLERIEKTVAQKKASDKLTEENVTKLRQRLANYATEHPLVLETALEQAPATTRIKVLAILDNSENRYTAAIESINSALQVRATQKVETKTVSGVIRRVAAGKWMVGGEVVNVDKDTVIDGIPSVGTVVQVTTRVQPDGTLLATKVKVRAINGSTSDASSEIGEPQAPSGTEAEDVGSISPAGLAAETRQQLSRAVKKTTFSGEISRIGVTHWLIGNRLVRITEDTIIEGAPETGNIARVNIQVFDDGSLVAAKIVVESDIPDPKTDTRPNGGSSGTPSTVTPDRIRPTQVLPNRSVDDISPRESEKETGNGALNLRETPAGNSTR